MLRWFKTYFIVKWYIYLEYPELDVEYAAFFGNLIVSRVAALSVMCIILTTVSFYMQLRTVPRCHY